MKYIFSVPDMSCNHCKMRISGALKENGVSGFDIDLAIKKVSVDTDKKPDEIIMILGAAGYPAQLEK